MIVRNVIQRARDRTPLASSHPVKIPVDPSKPANTRVLPNGTRLAEFDIVGLIGEGGCGIVYLAFDHTLGRQVAIKEYMPTGMATRANNLRVGVVSKDQAALFKAGLRSFVNEARLLAQFDSPSLVKVLHFWEGNDTAYMVMPFYEGITLKSAYQKRKIIPTEEWIKLFLVNLCDALEMIHQARCYHRGIAPDNILVLPEGQLLLLEFSAARRVINERAQRPTTFLKPGFAPIEQYASIADLKQGPWTDIYTLAAVVYYLITGNAPLPAVARYVKDDMVSACEAGRNRYGAEFLAAIDRALAVRPEQRFQSITELRTALAIDADAADAGSSATVPDIPELTQCAEPTVQSDPARDTTQIPAATKMQAPAATKPAPPAPPADEAKTRRIEPRLDPATMQRLSASAQSTTQSTIQASEHVPPDWALAPRKILISAAQLKTGAIALALLVAIGGALAYRAMSGGAGKPTNVPEPASISWQEPFHPIGRADNPVASVAGDSQATPPSSTADVAAAASAPASDAALWKEATTTRTAIAYQNYLEQYPIGRHARQAAQRLTKLQPERTPGATVPAIPTVPTAESAWSPPPGISTRAQTTPNSKPVATPGESAVWSQVNLADTAAGYRSYLNVYPDGPNARTARNRLDTARPQQPATPAPTAPQSAAKDPEAPASVGPAPPIAATGQRASGRIPLSVNRSSESTSPAPAVVQKDAPTETTKAPSNAIVLREAERGAPPLGTTIRVAGQAFSGNFAVDPASGIVSGSGRVTWSNGDRFDGSMVNGVKQGQGEFVWANGQHYKGNWARDLPNGGGALHFANGNDYVGQLQDGVPYGKGALRYADGGRYQGSFSNGLPDGIGGTAFKNGDAYDGHWQKGKSNGHGKYTWANGDRWEGEFNNDQRTTDGKMTFASSNARSDVSDANSENAKHATGPERE